MKRFKNILCMIENAQESQNILQRASKLAQDNQANLTVASVLPNAQSGFPFAKKEKQKELEEMTRAFSDQCNIAIKIFFGTPYYEIIYNVLQNNYDLVIKMPEDASWMHRLFGSNDMHLLQKCPCPVWFIKKESSPSFNNILAAVDVGTNSETKENADVQEKLNHQILQMASSLAVSELAQLHILHVWDAPEAALMQGAFVNMPDSEVIAYVEEMQNTHHAKLKALLHDAAQKQVGDMLEFLQPNIHLVRGQANKIIPRFVQKLQIDLIVMGTVARTGLAGVIMGNTAEDILNQIDCSVLAVKPPGFRTPITL
ncbi:universal stress protein, UspA [Sulfurimonas sediminis]|uniref:Universal stress protein, UspA n=1 Tax=Sulfurimonas sediminis TaxID=2590020 RepID=A0A7M1B036_9BACT|nr:universal stress protein [Sulfurimonas sediminis]QOP42995.1 universal stress protein, UspA [Sulfurimonas sediminis]